MKPTFIVIGAARSGTTSLYQYLNSHPEVYMSEIKEINYFSNERYWKKGGRWYESNFKNASKAQLAVGEISPSYTKAPFTVNVPSRIYDCVPDVRFVYIVRNPVERTLSHYLHRVRRGYEVRPFSEVITDIKNSSFVAQSLYHYQAMQYLKLFYDDQLLVLSYDQLKKDTKAFMEKIYSFIGVARDFQVPAISKIHNANTKIIKKNKIGLFVLALYRELIEQRRVPYLIKKQILNISDRFGEEVSMPVATNKEITILKEYFYSDSEKLFKDFGIEIAEWYS